MFKLMVRGECHWVLLVVSNEKGILERLKGELESLKPEPELLKFKIEFKIEEVARKLFLFYLLY